MKPKPTSRMHSPTASGGRSIRAPSASSRSADPHRLVAERLPCLATAQPAPAAISAAVVETLKVERPPPVPAGGGRACGREGGGGPAGAGGAGPGEVGAPVGLGGVGLAGGGLGPPRDPAEGLGRGVVAEAHAEGSHTRLRKPPGDLERDAGLVRSAG